MALSSIVYTVIVSSCFVDSHRFYFQLTDQFWVGSIYTYLQYMMHRLALTVYRPPLRSHSRFRVCVDRRCWH